MASYWTKKDDESEELRTIKPWEEDISHGRMIIPKRNIMSVLDLAKTRYSVRGYKPDAVLDEDLRYIMECTRIAPSAVNKQPWHFYVCRTADALDKVRQCYHREWFDTAPLVLICCINHDEEWVRANDGHTHGIVDISIAAEHICLAATECGLGSCWVCNFDVQLCKQLFSLPDNQEPAVLIPLGYPLTEEVPEKKRKAMDEIVTEL